MCSALFCSVVVEIISDSGHVKLLSFCWVQNDQALANNILAVRSMWIYLLANYLGVV